MARILIVDDDKSVLNAIKLLEPEGYEVVIVNNGRDAIEAISTTSFDIAIVDIFMLGLDGLETIKTFRQLAPDVPVIAISGFMFRDASERSPDFLAMSTKLGAAFYLRKPFRPRDLRNAIVVCLDGTPPNIGPTN
jgi:CheY-like chemotaxis protein